MLRKQCQPTISVCTKVFARTNARHPWRGVFWWRCFVSRGGRTSCLKINKTNDSGRVHRIVKSFTRRSERSAQKKKLKKTFLFMLMLTVPH